MYKTVLGLNTYGYQNKQKVQFEFHRSEVSEGRRISYICYNMKCISLFTFLFVFSCQVQGQKSYTLFYPYAERDDAAYQWPFNSAYNEKDSGGYYYAATVYKPFVVLKNDSEGVEMAPPPSYTIDTVYIAFSHENNSGKKDTLVLKIVDIGKGNMPGTKVLWSELFVTDKGLSKKNDWHNGYTHRLFKPNLTITNGQSFALVFEYHGDKRDTLGFRAIYKQDPKKDSLKTSIGYVYPATRPTYKKNNWLKQMPAVKKMSSASEMELPGKKGYTPVQHWDFYVRVRTKQ